MMSVRLSLRSINRLAGLFDIVNALVSLLVLPPNLIGGTMTDRQINSRDAYARLADCLLALKAQGATPETLAYAIVKAASESGVRRYHIAEAYETLGL